MSPNKPNSALEKQADWLASYRPGLRVTEQGTVVSVGDGISWIKGLPSAAIEDILIFADGSRGMVFDLNRDRIGAILLYETEALTAGTTVRHARHPLSIPVGDEFIGRVIDPLGTPLDGPASTRPCEDGKTWKKARRQLSHGILSINRYTPVLKLLIR